MPTIDPRTENHRASRLRRWNELAHKYGEYVLFWQENEWARPTAKLDVHPLDGAVNVFLDELLTHLRREDAVALVTAMLPGWGNDPAVAAQASTETVGRYVERSHPDAQWGSGAVDPTVAAEPARWRAWLEARLDGLGVPTERVFQVPDFGPVAAPPAPRQPWPRALLVAGGVALLVGGGATAYMLATRRRSLEEPESW